MLLYFYYYICLICSLGLVPAGADAALLVTRVDRCCRTPPGPLSARASTGRLGVGEKRAGRARAERAERVERVARRPAMTPRAVNLSDRLHRGVCPTPRAIDRRGQSGGDPRRPRLVFGETYRRDCAGGVVGERNGWVRWCSRPPRVVSGRDAPGSRNPPSRPARLKVGDGSFASSSTPPGRWQSVGSERHALR